METRGNVSQYHTSHSLSVANYAVKSDGETDHQEMSVMGNVLMGRQSIKTVTYRKQEQCISSYE